MNNKKTHNDTSWLLEWLCTEWGFCLPPDDAKRIAQIQNWDAESFAKEVLRAEGMEPDYEKKWFRKIKQRFLDEFGKNVAE